MNHFKFLTPAEMNVKIAQLRRQLEQINNTLLTTISAGPIAAQTKRLVAMALAKDANHSLEQIAESVGLLKQPDTAATQASEAGLLDDLCEIVDGVFEAIAQAAAEQLGINLAAIEPFLIEHNCVMLGIVEDMVDRANGKLAEASLIELEV